MKLIYLYGLPAVGKLTVATKLAKITGFKLFHNHLTSDYVGSIFAERSKFTNELKCKIALKMFEAAARRDVSLIFTMAHEKVHASFLKKIINVVERKGGSVLFVKLVCADKQLYERVMSGSRKKYGKAKSEHAMSIILSRRENFTTIPKSLIIDNTKLSPEECARKIKSKYDL